jgi:hypothetical protein
MENYKEIEKLLLAKRAVYQTEIDKIDSILLSLGGTQVKPGPKPGKRGGKSKMSAAARAAISRAMKLRWAKSKSKSGPQPGKKKFKMSAAGRAAIARAKKAWWAKKKAGK